MSYCWCALQCVIYSSWIAVWLFFYIVWLTHGEFFYVWIVESNVYGGTFGQELHTFTTTYYTAWRKMDPSTSWIIFISSVLSTSSSPDSRLIWPSFLLDGMIILSGPRATFPQTSCGSLGCCSTQSESQRCLTKMWQLSNNANDIVVLPLNMIFSIYILIILSSLSFRESKLRILIGRAQGYLMVTLPPQVLPCQKWNVHWRPRTLKLYALPLIPFLIHIVLEETFIWPHSHMLCTYFTIIDSRVCANQRTKRF